MFKEALVRLKLPEKPPPGPPPGPSGAGGVIHRVDGLPLPQENLARRLADRPVGERVLEQFPQHRRRYRADVGADHRGLHEVQGVADRGDQDLSVEPVVVVYLADLGDQLHPLMRDVVQAADER